MNRLQEVRHAAAYTALAQKLDMHIKNFDSDPNTQIRWLWELIQNAKDAPNRFKQTKIKQQLDDYYFTSSHNGDAFQIHQLHSVVAQYSTKKEKNSEQVKTTGKYGTGFITTYILSKIIELSGILRVQIIEDSDSQDQKKNFGENQNEQSENGQSQEQSDNLSIFRRIGSQNQKPTKFKNNEKMSRFIRNQIKQSSIKSMGSIGHKSSHIKKRKRNRDLQKRKRDLIFEKQFERLALDEEIQYEKQMDLLMSQLEGLSTNDKSQKIKRTSSNKQNKPTISKKLSKKKNVYYYYKKFSIPMDRSYTDRDEQLPAKIEKTQKRLTKLVVEAQYQSKQRPDFQVRDYCQKERTSDCFDTVFKYKIVDKKKFEMVERTILNARQLILYAFLFNDNLAYYEFIDTRKQPTDLSFSITKGESVQIGPNLQLVSYLLGEQYSYKKKQFKNSRIGYFVAYIKDNKAIAAVPVHIEDDLIQILKINTKLPKIFKDFPLIGCPDIYWNAIINSRQFYPNQKRSHLMLSYYDETNKDKVRTNWNYVHECFSAVKQIYLFLSDRCKLGLENLLILSTLSLQNDDDKSQINKNLQNAKFRSKFKLHLQTLVNQIVTTKFIPTRELNSQQEQIMTQPISLTFIQIAYKKEEIYNQQKQVHFGLSTETNQIFNFLFGDCFTLRSEEYQYFYEILNYKSQFRGYLQNYKLVQFKSLNDCLKLMENLNFKQFCVKIKVNYMQKLHDIYKLLKVYNQKQYLSLAKKPQFDFGIFLNENAQFKCLSRHRMKINNLPKIYEELAQLLKINLHVKDFLIHKQFSKYIKLDKKQNSFGIENCQNYINNYFQKACIYYDQKQNPIVNTNQLKKLYQLLLTFNLLKKQTVGLINKFIDFQKFKPFQFTFDKKQLRPFSDKVSQSLLQTFKKGFALYFGLLVKQKIDFKSTFFTIFSIKYYEEAIDYLSKLFKDSLLGECLQTVSLKLSLSGLFVNQKSLFKLNKNVQYPNKQDIQIYNMAKNLWIALIYSSRTILGNHSNQFLNLEDKLVHPLYPSQYMENLNSIDYSTIFKTINQNYQHFAVEQKRAILNLANKVNQQYLYGTKVDATITQKYKAWGQLIKLRLFKLFQLKYNNKELQKPSTQQFLFNLLNNPIQLKNAQLIYQHNEKTLYFAQLRTQLGIESKQQDEKIVIKQPIKKV